MNAKVVKAFNTTKKTIKKYSPEILTGVAIISGITGAVIACKKTLDVQEELDPIKEEINSIKKAADYADEKPDAKELAKVYGKAAKVVAKNYAVPVGLGVLAITSGCAACGISRHNYSAVVAAATIISDDFRRYRDNVIEDQGEEKDYMYFHGLDKKTVTETEVDAETGAKKKVKKEVLTKKAGLSELSIEFGPSNPNYTDSPALNRAFLMAVEEFANQKYACDTVDDYYMSEIYEAAGFTRNQLSEKQKKGSRIMGWSKKKNPNGVIKIGIFEKVNERANDAADNLDNKGEAVYILDFNIDGVIVDE